MRGPQRKNYPPVKVAEFPNLYEGQLPIKAAKKRDLDDMSKFLPSEYVPFYQVLEVEQ